MVASGSSLACEEAVAAALVASLEIDRYEPAIVSVVLDQMHRAAYSILSEARELALHAGRELIEVGDLQLADDMAADDNYAASPMPSRESMLQLSQVVNSQPLTIDEGHGLRLPPRDYQLTARSYQLLPAQYFAGHGAPSPRPALPQPSLGAASTHSVAEAASASTGIAPAPPGSKAKGSKS